MKTVKVKTNIMCGSCIAKVKPILDEKLGQGKWSVDIQDPKKILSVNEDLAEDEVIKAIELAGYKAERLS